MNVKMGKGSKRRPCQVPRKEFERRWDEAFKKTICICQENTVVMQPKAIIKHPKRPNNE